MLSSLFLFVSSALAFPTSQQSLGAQVQASRAFPLLRGGLSSGDLIPCDFGNGPEIVVKQYSFWVVLRFDPASGRYQCRHVSRSYAQTEGAFEPVAQIAVADVVADARPEVIVVTSTGRVSVTDAATWNEVSSFATGLAVNGMTVRDIEGDAHAEILVTTQSSVRAFSPSGATLWTVGMPTGYAMFPGALVVGQFDLDPAREIVTKSGVVIDADSHSIQWQIPPAGSDAIAAGDIDGDGRDEFIQGLGFGTIRAYDVDTQTQKWSIASASLEDLLVADIQGDSAPEVLVGRGNDIQIRAGQNGAFLGSFSGGVYGLGSLAAADVDSDGQVEVLWTNGWSNFDPSNLWVADGTTHAIEWNSIEMLGPVVGPVQADMDGDGSNEIVMSWRATPGGSARLNVLDGSTLYLRAQSAPLVNNQSIDGTFSIAARDLDGDGRAEVAVGTDRLYNGTVEIFHLDASGSLERTWVTATSVPGMSVRSIALEDVDADGDLEVIAAGVAIHSGYPGPHAYIYDLATQAEEWRTPALGAAGFGQPMSRLFVDDLDADGMPEIVVLREGADVFVVDGFSRALEFTIPGPFTALDLVRTDASPAATRILVTGDAQGRVRRFRIESGVVIASQPAPLSTSAVDALELNYRRTTLVSTAGRLEEHLGLAPSAVWSTLDYNFRPGATLIHQSSGPLRAIAGALEAVLGF